MRRATVLRAVLFVCAALFVALVWTFRAPLGRSVLAAVVDVATGGRVSFEGVALGRSGATLEGVRFEYGGVPVLALKRARLRYRLRDLLPGGARRYGLEAIDLELPTIVLVRRADGSFVLPGSGGGAPPGARGQGDATGAPLQLTVAVRGGSVELRDPARRLPGSRRLFATAVDGTGTIDGAGRTRYRLRASLSGDAAQSLTLAGSVTAGTYAVHRLRAPAVSLAPIVDYFINTPTAAFDVAQMRDVDLRAYAFGRDGVGLGAYHVAGSAELARGSDARPGLARPSDRNARPDRSLR